MHSLRHDNYREVLVLYLERPLHNRSEVHDLGRALQIQRLEGSRSR
jgi:hypothetical protein